MKILFITEPFYQYSEKIRDEIETYFQCKIDYFEVYYSGISNFTEKKNAFGRIIKKIRKGTVEKENRQRQQIFFDKHKRVLYDFILILLQDRLYADLLEEFMKEQKKATKILYLWDNAVRLKSLDRIKKYFDRIVSFDLADCMQYGFEFLPLFYLDDYEYKDEDKKYDFLMIGALHSDRSEVLEKILTAYPKDQYKWNVKLVAGKESVILAKLRGEIGLKTPFYICNKGISSTESAGLLKQSRIVVDIQMPGQNGLTMRSIESLAAHAKMITTNKNVREYDFYNENNICVIDRKNPVIDQSFVESDYTDLPNEIVTKYSIHNWVKRLFEYGADNK